MPAFDPGTIAATAVITTVVNTLVQEPLKRGIASLWTRVFGKGQGGSLEKRLWEWRREGDNLQAEWDKQQLGLERMKQDLPPRPTKKDNT